VTSYGKKNAATKRCSANKGDYAFKKKVEKKNSRRGRTRPRQNNSRGTGNSGQKVQNNMDGKKEGGGKKRGPRGWPGRRKGKGRKSSPAEKVRASSRRKEDVNKIGRERRYAAPMYLGRKIHQAVGKRKVTYQLNRGRARGIGGSIEGHPRGGDRENPKKKTDLKARKMHRKKNRLP